MLVKQRAMAVLLLACVVALAMAYVAQYVFGLLPCYLCLWTRVPFALSGVLALVALVRKNLSSKTFIALFIVIALSMASNSALSAFHSGVERHWWPGIETCENGGGFDFFGLFSDKKILSPSEVREALLKTDVVRCDVIPWSMFGLSIANYNVPFSMALAVFAGLAAWVMITGKKIESFCLCKKGCCPLHKE